VKVSLFYLPSVGSRADIEAGMAGARPELYTQMLREVSEQAILADQLGYDSISFTEHHFQIEGMELSNNPVMLDLFIAMQTRRIRVGQLGIVLPAENPIRVAENIAMLDHMSGGRANAGFARGYQRRWVDIMAQHAHGVHGALPDQHDEKDAANRQAFEENFQLIKKCWTQEMVAVKGKYWSLPAENTPWDIPATNMYGKGVENGIVKAVGVVPKPLQKPHPPLFQPFASSDASIRWCAKENVTAILPTMHHKNDYRLFKLYSELSGKPFGTGMGILRDIVVAETDAEAQELWQNSARFAAEVWFRPFGFRRGLMDPDTGTYPEPDEMLAEGYAWVGSIDTVCRQVEQTVSRIPIDWVFGWMFNSMIPHEKLMRSIELFRTKVLPRIGLA